MENSNDKTALLAGSFDPVTIGHESIALRAADIFDTLIVAVGDNMQKHTLFALDERVNMLKKVFAHVPNIKICSYQGLTMQFCMQNQISYIVRGVRSAMDYDTEYNMAQANRLLCSQIQTIWLPAMPEHIGVSSSAVREILHHGGDVKAFVPQAVYADIMKYKNR
ncbi:MAG: pantetheine-phosphate adenylyltransferase [Bacteroidales bacterium]|nr:pantetheine-phosphate adenylyltransferase [Bacteroidales bacterium]